MLIRFRKSKTVINDEKTVSYRIKTKQGGTVEKYISNIVIEAWKFNIKDFDRLMFDSMKREYEEAYRKRLIEGDYSDEDKEYFRNVMPFDWKEIFEWENWDGSRKADKVT